VGGEIRHQILRLRYRFAQEDMLVLVAIRAMTAQHISRKENGPDESGPFPYFRLFD
jgi:hypothetical protein